MVQIQNAAEVSIAALKKEGFLCVGVSFWGLTLLTGLLPTFKSRFPDITLRLFVDDYAHLKVMMQAGRIDLAVISITEEDDRPAQGAIDLRREELVVALPREAAYCLEHPDAEFISEKQLPQALDTLNFIAPDEGASIRRIEDALFRRLMYRPHVICEVERGGQRHPDGGRRCGCGHPLRGGRAGRPGDPFLPAGSAAVPGEHHGAAPRRQADRALTGLEELLWPRPGTSEAAEEAAEKRTGTPKAFPSVSICQRVRSGSGSPRESAREPWRFHRPER